MGPWGLACTHTHSLTPSHTKVIQSVETVCLRVLKAFDIITYHWLYLKSSSSVVGTTKSDESHAVAFSVSKLGLPVQEAEGITMS